MSGDERELRTAWQRHVATGSDADRWFDDLVARHREPQRHYHDLRHVRWVVHHARRLAAESADPPLDPGALDALVAAAFFHDAVYDPRRNDNEALSGQLAQRVLAELSWAPRAREGVAALIEATAGHEPADEPTEEVATAADVLIAADLGVLAAEPNRYGDYVRAVRREYAHLDDDEWRAGRAMFVTTMLERTHIFPARLELSRWERRARANLTAELATLG